MITLFARGLGGYLMLILLVTLPRQGAAQTRQQLRQAFADLHDDKIPHNCERATAWLFKNREALKNEMIAELYRTDWQGADAIESVLLQTDSFETDRRFRQMVWKRLRDDLIPDNAKDTMQWCLAHGKPFVNELIEELDRTDAQGRDALFLILIGLYGDSPDDAFRARLVARMCEFNEKTRVCSEGFFGMPWSAWRVIDKDFDHYEPMLLPLIKPTNNVWLLWSIAWELKKHGHLEREAARFTPEVLTRVASNLVADNIEFNSSQAGRLFLLLGDQSLPVLRQTAQSRDAQAKSAALALIDALTKGSRPAFEYLNRNMVLTITPFATNAKTPAWLEERMKRADGRQNYP